MIGLNDQPKLIDLQFNYPILQGQAEMFSRLVGEVVAAQGAKLLEAPPDGGTEEQRTTGAQWLSRNGQAVGKERVLLCAGGHHAVTVAMLALGLKGHGIAVDPLTYSNFKTQAASLGNELFPCAGDEQGMNPAALADAAAQQGVQAVYLMPTVHNPTGTIMPENRRREICEVARKHDLTIIDDDAYRFTAASPPPSFAMLAPERAFSVWSFTKPVAPAMKLAFLTFPEPYTDALMEMLKVTTSGVPGIFAEIGTRLIRSGALESLLAAKREEGARRQKMAQEILAGTNLQGHPTSFHVWISLPADKSANVVCEQLKADGVLVNSSDDYRATPGVKVNGMRIALGAARDAATLREGLQRVRERIQG
jgi:DNA-binding transcriptional MocR family regulator